MSPTYFNISNMVANEFHYSTIGSAYIAGVWGTEVGLRPVIKENWYKLGNLV